MMYICQIINIYDIKSQRYKNEKHIFNPILYPTNQGICTKRRNNRHGHLGIKQCPC